MYVNIYIYNPPKTNIDTQNDGLVSMLDFWGVHIYIYILHIYYTYIKLDRRSKKHTNDLEASLHDLEEIPAFRIGLYQAVWLESVGA